VPFLPASITSNSQSFLFYEVHVRPRAGEQGTLISVEVLDGDTGASLLSYQEADLQRHAAELRKEGDPGLSLVAKRRDSNTSVGLPAVVFIELVAELAKLPRAVAHRVTMVDPKGRQICEEGTRISVSTTTPIAVGSPLRGGDWMAVNTPHNTDGHRKGLLRVDGRETVAQRFAIDFVRVDSDMRTWQGDRLQNASYYAYGSEILAVADGVVSSAKDGIPENDPDGDSRAVEIALDTIAGNYVIVDSGKAKYCFYAHIQPRRSRVEPGAELRRGDVLGLLGNSGNSKEPRLHFQIRNANSPLGAEGLPYVFDSFDAHGLEERRLELPLERAVVAFPD